MNGDAADEYVRIMLNGTEVAIRLTGSITKNLVSPFTCMIEKRNGSVW